MYASPPRRCTEQHVLAVLASQSVRDVAHTAGVDPLELAAAVQTYQAAGRNALAAQQLEEWCHAYIHVTGWVSAEQAIATVLGSPLRELHQSGALAGWWFLRKHPHWLLRWSPRTHAASTTVTAALDQLVEYGAANHWRPGIYEPEILAFGGPQSMDISHALFHADSDAILTHLNHLAAPDAAVASHAVGRRELSLLLCTTLFRAATQDPEEQGDIWDLVTKLRPRRPDRKGDSTPGLEKLALFLTADTSPTSPLFAEGQPLSFAATWFADLAHAGQRLAQAAHANTLRRGLRHVLANHVVFHWNRLGLHSADQVLLARAARDTALDLPSPPTSTTAHG